MTAADDIGLQHKTTASRLLLLLILAVSAFIQYNVVTRSEFELPMDSDAAQYFSYAYNFKYSGIYSHMLTWAWEAPPTKLAPDSLRSPGYPMFLLAIPGLDTSQAYLRRVSLVQAAMAVVSVWLAFLIAARFLQPGWSHLAAAMTAINPHLANMSTYLLSETLFLFTMLVAIHLSISAYRSQRWATFFVVGLVWGCCSLVRPTVAFLPALFLFASLIIPKLKIWRIAAVLVFAGFVVIQLPWQVRNQITEMDPAQGSLMVYTIHHGSYPDFMYDNRPETRGWPFQYDPEGEAAERDLPSALADVYKKFRTEPLTYFKWYLLGKPVTFLSWGYIQGFDIYVYDTPRSPYKEDSLFIAVRALSLYMHWPLMLFGVGASLIVWWRPKWLGLNENGLVAAKAVSAIVLYAIGFHMIAAPYPRYSVPFRPLLYMLVLALVSAASSYILRSKAPHENSEKLIDGRT
ncbi:MAG: glycosyltransferase family 39 protein [Burkholderiales bacterium]|nr:glycosyltransferase family 39 protein [Burkholderiales bacterium]